jgi:dephospho-CoA kinase
MIKTTKKIIGLTGNIATGKSVVRRMLSNAGALGIDADVIAHRMLYPGAPAYQPVLNTFGEKILSEDRQISRRKLGETVFNNPEKLAVLETLIHPAVTQAIQNRIQQSKAPIIVIEAIKLLESDLKDICDSIWVAHASDSHQMERLLQTRKMTEVEAQSRFTSQPPQIEKLHQAEVVINTEGPYVQTWLQIQTALNDTINSQLNFEALNFYNQDNSTHSSGICATIDTVLGFWQTHTDQDVDNFYQTLGFQMLLPFGNTDRVKGIVIWDNWNFTATFSRAVLEYIKDDLWSLIFDIFSSHAVQNQCEIAIVPHEIVKALPMKPAAYGFDNMPIEELTYFAWYQAAEKTQLENTNRIWVKILLQPLEINDRV